MATLRNITAEKFPRKFRKKNDYYLFNNLMRFVNIYLRNFNFMFIKLAIIM